MEDIDSDICWRFGQLGSDLEPYTCPADYQNDTVFNNAFGDWNLKEV